MAQHPKQKVLVDLIRDMRELVSEIEASDPHTQGRYDQYSLSISKLAGDSDQMALAIAWAMVQAGGNRAGVIAGLRLSFPNAIPGNG